MTASRFSLTTASHVSDPLTYDPWLSALHGASILEREAGGSLNACCRAAEAIPHAVESSQQKLRGPGLLQVKAHSGM